MSTSNSRTVAKSDGFLILDGLMKYLIAEVKGYEPITLTLESNNGIHYFIKTGTSGETSEVHLASMGGK